MKVKWNQDKPRKKAGKTTSTKDASAKKDNYAKPSNNENIDFTHAKPDISYDRYILAGNKREENY